ncbi:26s protease regulatory subunit 6b homolog [Stylonychia lemnae]|uniref:26s protease regulatory subunit 6b homolog n=1 Tax=Stylonychia lemnae TaxID=5949 RepID=A0A078B4B9_STYLE|nr:26s protease regulatory subunit 6b homolog [Stylonychia lemnae]|eukprot:CDW88348.1 26s protease regulatory subunit 6b homolog [Stylonychia lemnae]
MESKAQLVLGILRETSTAWERRVPFTPEAIQDLISKFGIKVLIQPSTNRCFSDSQYIQAGAEVSDDLTQAHVIAGIKPAKLDSLLANKVYMMYTRVHTGAPGIVPYLKKLLEQKVTLVDYEKIRNEKDEILVGSSKLAGTVGMFNIFRQVGEYLLLRKNLNTPFLFTGGSAYMHRDKASCEQALRNISKVIQDQGGLPKEISPFVIGIVGSGIVTQGALELIQNNLPTERIDANDLKNLLENPPADHQQKIYFTTIRREHYLRDEGTDGNTQFNYQLLESNPEKFHSVIDTQILPYLSVLVNCANWKRGTQMLITNDQIKQACGSENQKLIAISDVAALINGPIEFFKEECLIERPYFLYDTQNHKRYESYDELKHAGQNTSNNILVYQGVEQLPAELSLDASKMFSDRLQDYVHQILQIAELAQNDKDTFDIEFEKLPLEIQKSIASTPSGKTGKQDTSSKPAQHIEKDLYMRMKELESELEILSIQEEYLKDEQRHLKSEYVRSKEEIKRIQSVYLGTGNFIEMIDESYGIVGSTSGSQYYVRVLSTLNREELKPNARVALHRSSHSVVDILPPDTDAAVQMMKMTEKPDVSYNDVGGLDIQKQEIREAIELPLIHPELYSQIGIDPPRGVLLYGPPGTGKTMLAKAVANQTNAAFIRMVGSEFVQKYLGEGPRMVRDVFRLARENAPSIVFIDEIDSIATKRFDANTGADREVQRILIELLNQMDGFDQTVNVKVIMATNRADTLDPALLRPGRLDRKIEFPLPDRRQKRLVFQTLTSKMNLSEEVDLEDFVQRPEKISAADIQSICQEAGMQAVRKNRYVILPKDFEKGYKKVVKKRDTEFDFYK